METNDNLADGHKKQPTILFDTSRRRPIYTESELRNKVKIHSLVFGLISAVVGGFMGIWAEVMFYFSPHSRNFPFSLSFPYIGITAGIILGYAAGYLFIPILFSLLKRKFSCNRFLNQSELRGGLIGLLCSCAVHGILMLCYWVKDFGPMIIGGTVGIIAGIMLSSIISRIVWIRFSHSFMTTPYEESCEK
jgi:hypothetical protein